jgi:undecaprenyl-diphosphatase
MTIWNAIILGLVQGIAEFLPISSSGHLAILQNLFGMPTTENGHMFFDVLLHFGTLISICIVYWEDIVSMFRELAAYSHRGRADDGQTHYPAARLFLMIVLGTLPLFLVLPVNDYVEQLYYHTAFIGIALIITGGILYAADHMAQGRKTEGGMRVRDALIIGLCQAVATIPGISRSGSTIAAGMATGLRRDFAVKYSFLLSLPAVLGANILSLIKAIKAGIDASLIPAYLIGMAVAMVSGVFAIGLVKAIVNKGKFGYFSYYCWTVGLLAIVLSFIF